MKFLTKILLLFFVLFQFSATIISFVENGNNSKVSIVLFDEDSSKETKEIKELRAEFILSNSNEFYLKTNFNQVNKNFYYLLTDYISEYILFLPPPELA
jgi:hypothetical protein